MGLAAHIAQRYARQGVSRDDVRQVAMLGLVKAVERFDPDHGAAFSSFAGRTIEGEIKRYFRDKTWTVHVPRGAKELSLQIRAASERRRRRPRPVADGRRARRAARCRPRRDRPRSRRGDRVPGRLAGRLGRRRRSPRSGPGRGTGDRRGRLRARARHDARRGCSRPARTTRAAHRGAAVLRRDVAVADRRDHRHLPDAGVAAAACVVRSDARRARRLGAGCGDRGTLMCRPPTADDPESEELTKFSESGRLNQSRAREAGPMVTSSAPGATPTSPMVDRQAHRTVLISETASVRAARRFVLDQLAGVLVHRHDDIALVTSELVTNAIEHGAGEEITVEVAPSAGGFDLTVCSTSPSVPIRRHRPRPARRDQRTAGCRWSPRRSRRDPHPRRRRRRVRLGPLRSLTSPRQPCDRAGRHPPANRAYDAAVA